MSNHTKHDEHSHNPSQFEAEALPNVSSHLTDTDDIQTPIRILQMDCPTEEGLLRTKLGGMPGVTMLEFNLMQRLLTVTHAPQAIEPILAAVRSLSQLSSHRLLATRLRGTQRVTRRGIR